MEGTIGEIRGFGGTFAPRNWGFCAGGLLAVSANSALYAILGTRFGGDGRVSFGLPDLRGRVPIGAGQGPGLTLRPDASFGGIEAHTLSIAEMPTHTHGMTGVSVDTANLAVDTSGLSVDLTGVTTNVVGTADLSTGATNTTLKANNANASQSAPTAGSSIASTAIPAGRSTTPAYGFNTAAPNTNLHADHIAVGGTAPVTGTGTPTGAAGLAGIASVTGTAGVTGSIENTGSSAAFEIVQPYLAIYWIICLTGIFPSRN